MSQQRELHQAHKLIEMRMLIDKERMLQIAEKHGPALVEWTNLVWDASQRSYIDSFNDYVEMTANEDS